MGTLLISGFIQDNQVKYKGKLYACKLTGKVYQLITSDHEGVETRNISHLTDTDFVQVLRFNGEDDSDILDTLEKGYDKNISDKYLKNFKPTITGPITDGSKTTKGESISEVFGRAIDSLSKNTHLDKDTIYDIAFSPVSLLQYNHLTPVSENDIRTRTEYFGEFPNTDNGFIQSKPIFIPAGDAVAIIRENIERVGGLEFNGVPIHPEDVIKEYTSKFLKKGGSENLTVKDAEEILRGITQRCTDKLVNQAREDFSIPRDVPTINLEAYLGSRQSLEHSNRVITGVDIGTKEEPIRTMLMKDGEVVGEVKIIKDKMFFSVKSENVLADLGKTTELSVREITDDKIKRIARRHKDDINNTSKLIRIKRRY